MASLASSARTSPIYDQIHIGHSKHKDGDQEDEYVDVARNYRAGLYHHDDDEAENTKNTLKWLVVAFAVFGLLLVICIFLLIYFIADNSQKINARAPQSAALFDREECVPSSFKMYVENELEKQREAIRRLQLMIQAHVAIDSLSGGGASAHNAEDMKNDIILLKSSNNTIFQKIKDVQLGVESNRNQMTLLSSKINTQRDELTAVSSWSVKAKTEIVDLMSANVTLHSRQQGKTRDIQKHLDQMKFFNARLSLLETIISDSSFDRIRKDMTTLKVWNKILSKKFHNQSFVTAMQRNQLKLLKTEVYENTAAISQIQSANQHDEFTKWYVKLNSKVEDYKKVFIRAIDEINRFNTTQAQMLGYLASYQSSQGPMIRYCTANVPSSACSPCHCISKDHSYNKYVCDCSNLQRRSDCKDYYDSGFRINGIYMISPPGAPTNISVFCAHDDGGGWTVIQRRVNSDIGFYRNWMQYKEGFGDLAANHYLGNDHINILTQTEQELKLELETFTGLKLHALYSHFVVEAEEDNFRLNCSGYSGNAGDSLCKYHSGFMFSTYDHDVDDWSLGNCAVTYRGGWWYRNCAHSNLNAHYFSSSEVCPLYTGIHWIGIGEDYNSLRGTVMKIRRKS